MAEVSYVDVNPEISKLHPSCSHGPALLFRRKTKTGYRSFYACSACRERKLCSFFHWADEKFPESRKKIWESEQKKFIGEQSHNDMFNIMNEKMSSKHGKQIAFCHSCSELLFEEDVHAHDRHDITLNISEHQLLHPTEIIKPLQCNKKEAQYLFSTKCVLALIDVVIKNHIKSVICIGAPRIHEYIRNSQLNITSILLDLDKRFHYFYSPKEFCWFNVFNFYFFWGEQSKKMFENFLRHNKGKDLLLILDPPFGGRLEPLTHTIKMIENLHKELNPHIKSELPVILIYPYFMEQHVLSCMPTFKMIDYHVTYDNHPLFSSGLKASKQGSPVRIFTNISSEKFVLPTDEGYKYCSICAAWTSSTNNHCQFCNRCTSKNGSTYVHCQKCQRCVKTSWKHCQICDQCSLPNHKCGSVQMFRNVQNDRSKDVLNISENDGFPTINLSKNKHRQDVIWGKKPKRRKKEKKMKKNVSSF